MKSIPYLKPFLALLTIFIISTAFQTFNTSELTNEVNFQSAISSGKIRVVAKSNGLYSNDCILLHLKNNSKIGLKVKIPQGSLFYPKNQDEQTLITVENQYVMLKQGQELDTKIKGYCSEHYDGAPTNGNEFTFGMNKLNKFDSLFSQLNGKKIPNASYQNIVWAVSDNSPVANISNENEDLIKLRDYLFKMTKQPKVDYSCATYAQVDGNGRITVYPYNVKGNLEFKVDHATFISQEVYTKEGKLKNKLPLSFSVLAGKTKFGFNVNVKGWDRGGYVLMLKSGKEEIAKYEFSI